MEGAKKLQVKLSEEFLSDLNDIYLYGVDTFGLSQAKKYEKEIWRLVENLSETYNMFPECRHLPTKSKMYRWIILESHLIIYKISKEVQVLRVLHASRNVSIIRSTRKIN